MLRTLASTAAIASTIMGSSLAGASAPGTPRPGRYAPAARAEPYVPQVELPDPTRTASVGLDALLAYADAHAPAVQAARARVGVADAARVDAEIFAPTNPQVRLGLGARAKGGATGVDVQATVRQQLELAGEPGLRRAAARADVALAGASLDEVRWWVHVEAHRLFATIRLAQARLRQAERFERFSRRTRDIARRQVEAGASSPLVLLVADAELARTEADRIEAAQRRRALSTRLAALVGWSDSTLPGLQGELPPVRRAPPVEALLERMAARHPSVRARELAVEAGQRRLALAEREAFPEPTFGLRYAREAGPGPEPEAHVLAFDLIVPLPLWRRNQGGRARAQAELRVADRERDRTVIRLRAELVEAADALDAAAARVARYERGVVPNLEKNLALLERAYDLGEVDVQQVFQTRSRLLDAGARYLDARIAYYAAAATLEGLVGAELWPTEEEDR